MQHCSNAIEHQCKSVTVKKCMQQCNNGTLQQSNIATHVSQQQGINATVYQLSKKYNDERTHTTMQHCNTATHATQQQRINAAVINKQCNNKHFNNGTLQQCNRASK